MKAFDVGYLFSIITPCALKFKYQGDENLEM